MPLEDAERTGRIRDNLMLRTEACAGRVKAVHLKSNVARQFVRMENLFDRAISALHDIQQHHSARQGREAGFSTL